MIDARVFVAKTEEIAAEEPRYKQGGDGNAGYCDCIGLIIGAIRRAGGQWRGLHGSNYAARREMDTLKPISGSAELVPGEVVFKAYDPGQGGYNLPDRYEKGGEYYNGDLKDYYHVGIVTSVYPLRIRHMTSPRSKVDTSIGKWGYHGKLKKVSDWDEKEKEGGKMGYKAKVTGGSLNMRKEKSTVSERLAKIPDGTVLEIGENDGTWCSTSYNGLEGYVMARYLVTVEEGADEGETISIQALRETIKRLEAVVDDLADLAGMRG